MDGSTEYLLSTKSAAQVSIFLSLDRSFKSICKIDLNIRYITSSRNNNGLKNPHIIIIKLNEVMMLCNEEQCMVVI